MKLIKTISNLYAKAKERETETEVGVANINGRMNLGYVSGLGRIQVKYAIVVNGDIVNLIHWGTRTLEVNTATKEILYHYGESNSDRDSINTLLYEVGMSHLFKARYFPSKYSFIIQDENGKEIA